MSHVKIPPSKTFHIDEGLKILSLMNSTYCIDEQQILDWCNVTLVSKWHVTWGPTISWGSKVDMGLQMLISSLHSIVNTIWRTCVSNYKISKHALWLPLLNSGRSTSQSSCCTCFIVDLLMQHKYCCENLISRSWRIREKDSSNTHIHLT